mgnify:FL=1|jgi:hypothetical protein
MINHKLLLVQEPWLNETCEDCRFRVNRLCRKNPPTLHSEEQTSSYPKVTLHFGTYQAACSQWKKPPGNNYGDC